MWIKKQEYEKLLSRITRLEAIVSELEIRSVANYELPIMRDDAEKWGTHSASCTFLGHTMKGHLNIDPIPLAKVIYLILDGLNLVIERTKAVGPNIRLVAKGGDQK